MKCIICHSENIKSMNVNEEIKDNKNIINIPITVSVCRDCGERYYDRKTVRYLENIREKIKLKSIKMKKTGKVLTLAG